MSKILPPLFWIGGSEVKNTFTVDKRTVGWEHPNYANTSIVEREGGQDAPTTVTGRAGCPPHKKMIVL